MPESEKRVGSGDRLRIVYSIRHQQRVLEASDAGESVVYSMGQGQWPQALEAAMLEAREGDRLQLHFDAADNLFGRPDPDRIVEMEQGDFAVEPNPGELIEFELSNGERIEGQVLLVIGDTIQVDFNHPYAGRELDVEIEIISILERNQGL